MVTLISVHNSNERHPRCIGRCDEKCYDAKEEKCDCVCGGMNHGKGKEQAIENTQKYSGDMMEQWKKQKVEELGEKALGSLRYESSLQLGMMFEPVSSVEEKRESEEQA